MSSYWFYHEWDNTQNVCKNCGRTDAEIGPAPDAHKHVPGSKWRIGSVKCWIIGTASAAPATEPAVVEKPVVIEDKPEPEPEKPKRKRIFGGK